MMTTHLKVLDRLERMVSAKMQDLIPERVIILAREGSKVTFRQSKEVEPYDTDREAFPRLHTGIALLPGESAIKIVVGGKSFILGGVAKPGVGARLESPAGSYSDPPVISPLAGLGSGGVAELRYGTDDVGAVRVIVGTSPSVGDVFSMTFSVPKPVDDYAALLWPADADAAAFGSNIFVDVGIGRSETVATFRVRTALSSGSSYNWYYTVLYVGNP